MITGFNTDVMHDGVTYHVQTEDKGVDTPLILSLVYEHGTILASKRSTYEDLFETDFDERVLEQRLKRQHKLMCAAVQSGRIEDLKRMTAEKSSRESAEIAAKKSATPKPAEPEKVETVEKIKAAEKIEEKITIPDVPPPNLLKNEKHVDLPPMPIGREPDDVSKETKAKDIPPPAIWDIPVIEDVEILEQEEDFFGEGFILSSDAIKIVSNFADAEVGGDDELKIKFLDDYTFTAGDQKNVNLLVCRGMEKTEVENASIMVKVLGAEFRPLIFHAKTDKHGVATVFVKVPNFRSGRAALLVRAITGTEETELRKIIQHKND